nr:IPExxxVDY family protein [Allomuricauda sp.]
MLTTHKIGSEFYEDDYDLIAIHSDLENFAMTYALNSFCGLRLKRTEKDLMLDENLAFPVFEWNDELSDTHWMLFCNSCEQKVRLNYGGLFKENVSVQKSFLLTEQKEVDYFLKVDSENSSNIDELTKKVNQIPRVVTSYYINTKNLKSKSNLIF